MLLITAVLLVMGMTGNEITFIEGVILWIFFIAYLLCMLGIGIFFFVKNRNGGEKLSLDEYPALTYHSI